MPDMPAAIYARYSTDRQSESSIDDQVRICQKRAESLGHSVTAVFADNGVSGSIPVDSRHGGRQLLAADFDLLIIEGLDRLSRDLGEQDRIVKRLEFRGVRLIGVADGYDSEMSGRVIHRGMRGIINEVYLDDLRHKTHRGLAGKAAKGLAAGGTPYGYRTIDVDGGRAFEIHADQAEWVRWIFQQFIDGMPYKKIAAELNRLGVPSPRNSTWAVSAIYGSPQKGTGILNNELYIGRYVWNKSRWQKNPDTGRRKRIERPPHEWQITDLPELRIVDLDTWGQAKTRQQHTRLSGGTRGRGGAPEKLLSGLLRCGECGAPMVTVNSTRYGCSNRMNRGTCNMNHTADIRRADQAIIGLVRDDLLSDQAIKLLETEVARLIHQNDNTVQFRKRRHALQREITNIADAIAKIGLSEPLQKRYQQAQSELDRLIEKPLDIGVIPDLIERYRRQIDNLSDVNGAKGALRDLLGEMPVTYDGKGLVAEINKLYPGATARVGLSVKVVAGAGFEPTTFGL